MNGKHWRTRFSPVQEKRGKQGIDVVKGLCLQTGSVVRVSNMASGHEAETVLRVDGFLLDVPDVVTEAVQPTLQATGIPERCGKDVAGIAFLAGLVV